jgi:hypothetical protein
VVSAIVILVAATVMYFHRAASPQTPRPAERRGDIVFSGYRFTESEALFSLTDGANRHSSGPLKIGQSFAGATVVSFDPTRETLTLRLAGRLRELPLRESRPAFRAIFFQAPDATSDGTGRLEFSGMPLKYIVDHFAAVSGRKITVTPKVGELKVTGHFRKNSVDSFLYVLPQIAPVRIEFGPDNSVQILPR